VHIINIDVDEHHELGTASRHADLI